MIVIYHPPFSLRGDDDETWWYCIVEGKMYGPWDNKVSAIAGYKTELLRHKKREYENDKH